MHVISALNFFKAIRASDHGNDGRSLGVIGQASIKGKQSRNTEKQNKKCDRCHETRHLSLQLEDGLLYWHFSRCKPDLAPRAIPKQ